MFHVAVHSLLYSQANAGRVFDSVLTIASALDSAARDGVTISSVPIHAGICSGKSSKPMEHGAVLSRYLRGVSASCGTYRYRTTVSTVLVSNTVVFLITASSSLSSLLLLL